MAKTSNNGAGCWVCNPASRGELCRTHQRQIAATATREARSGYRVSQADADAIAAGRAR
jgi:hypothetical protein